jgi:hypothetical protein
MQEMNNKTCMNTCNVHTCDSGWGSCTVICVGQPLHIEQYVACFAERQAVNKLQGRQRELTNSEIDFRPNFDVTDAITRNSLHNKQRYPAPDKLPEHASFSI